MNIYGFVELEEKGYKHIISNKIGPKVYIYAKDYQLEEFIESRKFLRNDIIQVDSL